VRVVFDATTLYVGVVCWDREPSQMVVSDARRDAPLDDTDSFQMIFDAFRDEQNGFVFGTNPAGIEYDGQLQNDTTGGGFGGGGGRFGGGSGGGFNVNWDGAWKVAARSGDFGWSAEFAIPFATLPTPPRRMRCGASTSSATSGATTRSSTGRSSSSSGLCSASRTPARSKVWRRPAAATLPSGFALRRIRPQDWHGIHELRPHVTYNGYWGFDGCQESEFIHLDTPGSTSSMTTSTSSAAIRCSPGLIAARSSSTAT
jgi:hypothetical protein